MANSQFPIACPINMELNQQFWIWYSSVLFAASLLSLFKECWNAPCRGRQTLPIVSNYSFLFRLDLFKIIVCFLQSILLPLSPDLLHHAFAIRNLFFISQIGSGILVATALCCNRRRTLGLLSESTSMVDEQIALKTLFNLDFIVLSALMMAGNGMMIDSGGGGWNMQDASDNFLVHSWLSFSLSLVRLGMLLAGIGAHLLTFDFIRKKKYSHIHDGVHDAGTPRVSVFSKLHKLLPFIW